MKTLCILALLAVFLALPLAAQTAVTTTTTTTTVVSPNYQQALYVGGVANTQAVNDYKLSAQFEKLVAGQYDAQWSIYSITDYDLSGIVLKPLNLNNMQITTTTGLETIILKPNAWLSILAEGAIGVNAVVGQTTGLAAGTGPGLKLTHNKFVAKVYGQFVKTSVSTMTGEARFYAGIRW